MAGAGYGRGGRTGREPEEPASPDAGEGWFGEQAPPYDEGYDTGGYPQGAEYPAGYDTGGYPQQQYGTGYDAGYDPAYGGTGQYPVADPYAANQGYPAEGYPQGGGDYAAGYDTGGYPQQQYGTDYDTGQYAPDAHAAGPYDTGGYPGYADPVEQPPAADPDRAGFDPSRYPRGSSGTGEFHVVPPAGAPAEAAPPPPAAAPPQTPPAAAEQQPPPPRQARLPRQGRAAAGKPPAGKPASAKPASEAARYAGEEFSFVDDQQESEDVIDWLSFAETRSERRDERRKKNRFKVVGLAAAVLVVVGGMLGWLLTGSGKPAAKPVGDRNVIAIQMKDVTGGHVSTALLVENPATRKGTILLLPDDLAVDNSDGSGTIRLDKALDAEGTGGTRDALSGLLGVQLGGSWRLDSSFLTVMVDTLGGVAVNTNATIKSKGKTVVAKGDERLNGDAAVAYATYRAKGESANAQLSRFGQVLLGVLNALPTDSSSVTSVINDMGAVPDPSLPNSRLGAALAPLAKQAQSGAVSVRTLPVMANGSLGGTAARTMVSRVLGGAIKKSRSSTGTAARVSLVDATGGSTGAKGPAALASADLTNGGFTVLPGQSRASAVAKSRVEYADASRKTVAQQVASALGLPSSAVHKVSSSMTGDVTVTLGKDFKG